MCKPHPALIAGCYNGLRKFLTFESWRKTNVGEFLQPWHMIIILFFFLPILTVIVVVPYWMIFKKAGFTPALSLLMIVPVVHFVVLYVLAFAEWKVIPAPQG